MSTKKTIVLSLFLLIGIRCFGEPIVLERNVANPSDKPRDEIPIKCDKNSNSIIIEFTENVGSTNISIIHNESGNCITQTVTTTCMPEIVNLPNVNGSYIITISTEDAEYIGDFSIE